MLDCNTVVCVLLSVPRLESVVTKIFHCSRHYSVQARRQGGFEGVRANPPFGLQKILFFYLFFFLLNKFVISGYQK